MRCRRRGVLPAVAGFAIACGGGDSSQHTSPSEKTGAGTSPPSTEVVPEEISSDMIALGNEIFHGRVANGLCYTCHGMDARGGPGGLGPDLTDSQWLHGDGTIGPIIETIRTGVAQPMKAPAPMPPMGGAALTEEELRAVAAYVYSLSNAEVSRTPS